MKLGRNEPCHCGSGKKYKHCHLIADEAPDPRDLVWQRVKRATDGLVPKLIGAAEAHFGATGLPEAWSEFWLDDDVPFEDDNPMMQVFAPWFLHNWRPDPHETEMPESAHALTAAEAYLRTHGTRVEPLVVRYLEACVAAQFSFHEIVSAQPGYGFRLRDVILGTEADVLERSGSQRAEIGDILFAKVVPIDGIAVLDGCSPIAVPPLRKAAIIELRKRIAPKDGLFPSDTLELWDIELRSLFLDLAENILNPRMPELRNTDGDALEWRTLAYDIEDVQAVFDSLKHLATGASAEDLESFVERDATGTLVAARFSWIRAGRAREDVTDATILGSIAIEAGRLTAEVNSARRAQQFEKIVRERLGAGAKALPQVIRSVESALRERRARPDPQGDARDDEEQRRLAALPEVQAAMSEMMRNHYRRWVDDKIPALGNRTPRRAVQDAEGREAVEALLLQIERDGARMQPPLDPTIVAEVRETLGLVPRG